MGGLRAAEEFHLGRWEDVIHGHEFGRGAAAGGVVRAEWGRMGGGRARIHGYQLGSQAAYDGGPDPPSNRRAAVDRAKGRP
jgi:hypothetical protein